MRVSSRKLLIAVAGLGVLGFLIYRSFGALHLGDFSGAKLLHGVRNVNLAYLLISLIAIYVCYALRSLRWQVFQENLGPSQFAKIYEATLAGFAAVFLLGRAAELARPLLIARKEKLPVADMFGIYALERIFDIATTAVIASLGLFLYQSQAHEGQTAAAFQKAANTAGTLLFAAVIVAVAMLVYLRLHGTALLERRLQTWHAAHGWKARVARTILGFARGVQTLRTWGELALAIVYTAAHWFLVLLIYYWVALAFGGTLATIGLGGSLLVLAFTMVGSALQLPGVGGGMQVACFLAFTTIFGVEKEPAAAAAIVTWLITFAAVSLAGVPLLVHEGWSVGQLREMAKHKNEIMDRETSGSDRIATPGESAE